MILLQIYKNKTKLSKIPKPVDWTTIYARKIVTGEIKACKKVIQASERHLNDLKRSEEDPSFGYVFVVEKADHVIRFMEKLPDLSTGAPTTLALFQKFISGSLYGWRSKETGFRRFTKAYISMARKNGKSVLVAGFALYELIYGESPKYDRQIYCTANSKDQARTVYKMVVAQLKKVRSKSKKIKKLTKILKNEVLIEDNESILKALSRDTDNLDSLNVLLGILDEYHTANEDDMMEVLESSQGQQDQPLIIIISTAGFKLNGVMYSVEYPYITDLLDPEKELVNENYFALCYEQEEESEIEDDSTWIKSNPLLEVDKLSKKMMTYLHRKLDEALQKNSIMKTLVKNFNMWQSASEKSFLSGSEWKDCFDKKITDLDLYGREVYIGADLSRTRDLSALTWLVPLDKEKHFFMDSKSFIGTKGFGIEGKEQRDMIDYRDLERKGYCEITTKDSGIVDYKRIIEFIDELVEKYNFKVAGIYYDEYSSPSFITELEDKYTLIEVRQGLKTLSPATKQFQIYADEKQIHHSNNPLLNTAINNAIVVETNDAVQINKNKNRNKIDPIAAGINAFTGAQYHEFGRIYRDSEYYKSDNFSF